MSKTNKDAHFMDEVITQETTKRKVSVHGTIQSFKGVVDKVIELELISDESKQQLLAIKDEAVLRYVEKLKL